MMSTESILHLANEAGRRAERKHKEPAVYATRNAIDTRIRKIPNLGSYVPKGWKMVDYVQSNKDGRGDGFSLGLDQVKDWVESFIAAEKTYGFAIVEEGPFQIVIGRFEHLPDFSTGGAE